jgi:hypothetical protein
MSQLNTISKLTSTAVALGICFSTAVAEAASIERGKGAINLYDPNGTQYLNTLTPTALSTGIGNQYTFNTSFTGAYTGVSVSGVVSIGEINFTATGGSQTTIVNPSKAKLFKLSQVEIKNNSGQVLNYTSGYLFGWTNTFTSFTMNQFYTVATGSVGLVANNGTLTCDKTQEFNLYFLGWAKNLNTVIAQNPLYATNSMLDTDCNFDAIKYDKVLEGGSTVPQFINPGSATAVEAYINQLILQSGYTLKLTNSLDLFGTDYQETLSNDDIENLVNVSVGIGIDDPNNFKFKVFNPETSEEIVAKGKSSTTVPESSSFFGLLALGGLLISQKIKKVKEG